jgi:hypothetical protein
MVLVDWVLPLLIGIVAAVALMSILWNNPKVKAYFTDIIGLTDDNTSNLGDLDTIYQAKIWKPIPYNQNETIEIPENEYIEHKKQCDSKNLDNMNLRITTIDSPLYTGNKRYPVYNYYPEVIVN